MAYMVKAKVMKEYGIPIVITQFLWHMSSHIIVDLCKILILVFS
jgi:hypothetical protein